MQDLLHHKFQQYLAVHYPDRLLDLEAEGSVKGYIEEKVSSIAAEMEAMIAAGVPAYEVEVTCMDVLINALPASRYDYLYDVLSEEFTTQFALFEQAGLLLYEICNIIAACGELLLDFNEGDEALRLAVIDIIQHYFDHPSTVDDGL